MDRIYATIDGEEREIFPIDYRNAKFITEREEGYIFFRTKYQGTMTIKGEDFEDFVALGESCDRQPVRVEREGVADWHGYFTISDGEFNLDDCTFTFSPKAMDGYEDFLEQGSRDYNVLTASGMTVNVPAPHSVAYTNCRNMKTVIQSMINEIDPSYTLGGDFFYAANNPVTGLANTYLNVFIAHLSDIKRPLASEKARFYFLSFLEIMAIIRDMFNVWWSIKGDEVILEHYTYYRSADSEDLRSDAGDALARRYRFDMSKMWKFERFEMLNFGIIDGSIDFVNQGFAYEGNCLLTKDNERVRAVKVATDIESLMDANVAEKFPDDGLAMILSTTHNSGGSARIAQGVMSGNNLVNADLSWANLLNQFWRDGRVLMTGIYFTNPIAFWTAEPNKQQLLTVSMCADFNPYGVFETALGDSLGVDARLVRAEQSTMGGFIRLTLAYAYPDETPVPPDPPVKSVTVSQSDLSPNTLNGFFSELSGVDLVLEVVWTVRDAGGNVVDNDTENWSVPNNVVSDSFDPDFPEYQAGYCYELAITPSGGGWTVIINQSFPLIC